MLVHQSESRRELLDRTLIWNQRHLMIVLGEYEDFYNTHRPHRTLNQEAPLRPLLDGITDRDEHRDNRPGESQDVAARPAAKRRTCD